MLAASVIQPQTGIVVSSRHKSLPTSGHRFFCTFSGDSYLFLWSLFLCLFTEIYPAKFVVGCELVLSGRRLPAEETQEKLVWAIRSRRQNSGFTSHPHLGHRQDSEWERQRERAKSQESHCHNCCQIIDNNKALWREGHLQKTVKRLDQIVANRKKLGLYERNDKRNKERGEVEAMTSN